jgi:hypothetical protein
MMHGQQNIKIDKNLLSLLGSEASVGWSTTKHTVFCELI